MSRPVKSSRCRRMRCCRPGSHCGRPSRLRVVACANFNRGGALRLGSAGTGNLSSCMWTRGTRWGGLGRPIYGHIKNAADARW